MEKIKFSTKLFLISLAISIMLINVGVSIDESMKMEFSPSQQFLLIGENISFSLFLDFNAGDNILNSDTIRNFTIFLKGAKNISCTFLPNTTLLDSCEGVLVQLDNNSKLPLNESSNLSYNIKIDTSKLNDSEYFPYFIVHSEKDKFIIESNRISVFKIIEIINSCSVRADGGFVEINNGLTSSNSHINLFASGKKAKKGQGYLTLQKDKIRKVYKFSTLRTLRVRDNIILFDVYGDILIDGKKKIKEKARIIFDPLKIKIDIDGKNVKGANMNVAFAKC